MLSWRFSGELETLKIIDPKVTTISPRKSISKSAPRTSPFKAPASVLDAVASAQPQKSKGIISEQVSVPGTASMNFMISTQTNATVRLTEVLQNMGTTLGSIVHRNNDLEMRRQELHEAVHLLRQKLLKRILGSFKPREDLNSGTDAQREDRVKVGVQCSLAAFTDISLAIKEIGEQRLSASFIPSFEATQNPSSAVQSLRVFFPSLRDVCTFLRFRDDADFRKLLWREATNDNVPYMRVMGSLRVYSNVRSGSNEKNYNSSGLSQSENVSSVDRVQNATTTCIELHEIATTQASVQHAVEESEEVDTEPRSHVHSRHKDYEEGQTRIFIGASVVDAELKLQEIVTSERQSSVILEQRHEGWDSARGCFLSKWKAIDLTVAPHYPDPTCDEMDDALHSSFTLHWRRTTTPSQRTWTVDAMETDGNVFGVMELVLPCVLLCGSKTVRRIRRFMQELEQSL